MNHRQKMCEHCAFRKSSLEMREPERREHLVGECLHRIFYCHETMLQTNPDDSKWIGSFDSTRKRDGSPAEYDDHQVCAGFAKFYGADFGIDTDTIPAEDHALITTQGKSP